MSARLDEETKRLLKTVVDHFDQEDRAVRERQLRYCRRLKLYWNNFSQIYWSETARDYRIFNGGNEQYGADGDQDYYDRPVNIFKALLETVIAALSIDIPGVSCAPDNADNPDDLSTAKAGDKIAELLYKHNDVVFFWLHALYIHMTEGMVAAYQYEKEDKEYGSYKEKKYKDEEVEAYVCPECGEQIPDEILSTAQENKFAPDDDDILLDDTLAEEEAVCPECASALNPNLQKSKLIIPRFVGMTDKPKSRICLDIYGQLYVKIANYAKKQSDTPYLIWSYETHYANALEMYKDLWEDMPQGGWSNIGINDPNEQYARLNPQYRNMTPEEQVTIKNAWLRPAAFNILNEEDSKKLHRKFPGGAKVGMVNDIVADGCNEALDDCWTLTRNPMHDFLVHDPTGDGITNIQDITNDLISLTLQTIEHGIEQTWADPSVVNFEAQSQIEAQPGTITPTKTQGGASNISQAFFSTKAASLSPEIFQFYQIIQQLGQFISAAMPSIFGGSQESGSSRTASEYAMSRSASLQRLQITWKMLTIWWKSIFGKAIPAYIKLLKEDERFVVKNDAGNFENVWIRLAEIKGKIGSVELEAADKIPISDEQKAEMVMRLMELNNQEIIEALASPENLPFIRKIVQMPEFKLPGEDDRQKQYEEIQELTADGAEPEIIPVSPIENAISMKTTGQPAQPQEFASIRPEIDVDDHEVEAAICRSWLISSAGRLAKVENELGYKNVLLHMKEHLQIFSQQQQQQMMQQMQMQALQSEASHAGDDDSDANGKQTPVAKKKQPEKISEDRNVNTPIQ